MFRKLLIALLLPATALLAQPDKTAWEVLKQGLAGKSPDKRRQALTAIGSIGLAPEAIQQVELALKDQDVLVRLTALAVLGQMKSKASLPALQSALDDSSMEVAFAAAQALLELGDKRGRALIEDILSGQRRISDAKGSGGLLGPFNLGILGAEQALKDGSASARALAATMLGQDCDAPARQLLEQACAGEKNWAVKAAAAKALGQCGQKDAIPKLEQSLADSRDAVRFMAAAAIIRLVQKP
jgi:HEAT repeat protein